MDQRARSSDIRRESYLKADRERTSSAVSTANYYFLTFFVAVLVFVIVLAVLYDGYDESPWVVAIFASILSIISFVLLREIVLRRSRERVVAARRLASHLSAARNFRHDRDENDKLTLERNEKLLREIRSKSDAAKVLGNLAEAHREVFDLCDDYLMIASREMARARAGSPRIPAMRKGSVTAAKRHRLHMLKWAELKSRSFADAVKTSGTIESKVRAGEEALSAVDRAIGVYPAEKALADSRELLLVFLASTKLRSLLDEAEHAAVTGEFERALDNYEKALIELRRHPGNLADAETLDRKIRSETERLRRSIEE